jgi:hypothetical protein
MAKQNNWWLYALIGCISGFIVLPLITFIGGLSAYNFFYVPLANITFFQSIFGESLWLQSAMPISATFIGLVIGLIIFHYKKQRGKR